VPAGSSGAIYIWREKSKERSSISKFLRWNNIFLDYPQRMRIKCVFFLVMRKDKDRAKSVNFHMNSFI